jgi:hypothetical protein
MPAVVAVLAIAVGAVSCVAAQVRLQSAAAAIVRALGRGDSASAESLAARLAPDARRSVRTDNDVICLTCRRTIAIGAAGIDVSGTACAPTRGR